MSRCITRSRSASRVVPLNALNAEWTDQTFRTAIACSSPCRGGRGSEAWGVGSGSGSQQDLRCAPVSGVINASAPWITTLSCLSRDDTETLQVPPVDTWRSTVVEL